MVGLTCSMLQHAAFNGQTEMEHINEHFNSMNYMKHHSQLSFTTEPAMTQFFLNEPSHIMGNSRVVPAFLGSTIFVDAKTKKSQGFRVQSTTQLDRCLIAFDDLS